MFCELGGIVINQSNRIDGESIPVCNASTLRETQQGKSSIRHHVYVGKDTKRCLLRGEYNSQVMIGIPRHPVDFLDSYG